VTKAPNRCVAAERYFLLPDDGGVDPRCGEMVVGVVAFGVTGKGVVEALPFDDGFKGCIVGPFEAEEAGHEVLCRLQHSILRCCPCDDLGGGVVQLGVVVIEEDAGIEEFLASLWNQDFGAEFVRPCVQKGQQSVEGGGAISCHVLNFGSEV
jgi:hypothetical protein